MRLPKLPTEAFSLIGPVPIVPLVIAKPEDNELYGRFAPGERVIEIAQEMTRDVEWVTYWHEVSHVILTDAGANNSLTEHQQEVVCDAVGTYLTAMMRAGYLSVRKPRTT